MWRGIIAKSASTRNAEDQIIARIDVPVNILRNGCKNSRAAFPMIVTLSASRS
jgi:hypothetical protein